MNFEQMEYIKEINSTQSISLAAQNLHISQSAISQSISLIEKELGVKLFKRSRLGTTPTDEGKNIIKKVLEIVKKADEIKEEAQCINSSFKGELKIAATPPLLMPFLPHTLSSFKKEFPQIKINILEAQGKTIIEKVNAHTVDLGFITFNKYTKKEPMDHLDYKYFYHNEDVKVILSKDSPLAYNESLRIEDLFYYPLVIYDSEYWRSLIIEFEKKNGSVDILFTTINTELIKKAVSEGLAFGILPSFMLNDDPYIESKRIVPVSLVDYEFDSSFKFGCIYSQKSDNKKLIKEFLKYLELVYPCNLYK